MSTRRIYIVSDPDDANYAWVVEALKKVGHTVYERSADQPDGVDRWADACVLLHPADVAGTLRAGYILGSGKPTYVLSLSPEEVPYYPRATGTFSNIYELLGELSKVTR